ncbi:MAG: site-specific integrase [Muribaculum sp.]|nr:site-specific integrase [Muribaculum sp.]
MKKVTKEFVYLRQRKRANGLIALYLDICRNNKRTNEYLKLYLVPERTKEDRDKNRATLQLAQSIKAQRMVEIQNGEFGFKDSYAEQTLFFDYYRAMTEKRRGKESHGNWGNWLSCLKHLEKYEPRHNITFADITPQWVEGFRNYLDTKAEAFSTDKRKRKDKRPLSQNSKQSYFNKLRACLNQAYEDRIIAHNPIRGITGFKAEEGTRQYLTLEEVRKLAAADCDFPEIKRAFLFSCLTGLRRSDIIKLTWGEVQRQGDYVRLVFKQKKTGGQEYLDISPQAAALIDTPRGKSTDHVFGDIRYPGDTNQSIRVWCLRAGIDKNITFHCGRHTFAVLMLDLGTDIYTVSKLLGHRELTTTQIYAKVLDKNKQAAVSRIPDVFSTDNSTEQKED